jgi:hypothetical protein
MKSSGNLSPLRDVSYVGTYHGQLCGRYKSSDLLEDERIQVLGTRKVLAWAKQWLLWGRLRLGQLDPKAVLIAHWSNHRL